MKTLKILIFPALVLITLKPSFGQSNLNLEEYATFLKNTENLSSEGLQGLYPLNNTYFFSNEDESALKNIFYIDSLNIKYDLTSMEKALLAKNRFMVTERLSYANFINALSYIYQKDLPVFVSTDAILQTLHISYDRILKNLERNKLEPNISVFLANLYNAIPTLEALYYKTDDSLLIKTAMEDVDLYVTLAQSLITNNLEPTHIAADTAKASEIWKLILDEKLVQNYPLFTEEGRNIDFSQFTVRGHYVDDDGVIHGGQKSLEPYFKAMMWLGRIDFFLTPAPDLGNPEDIRRMNLGAFMLNQLVDYSGSGSLLEENDSIISFLVGKSDNLCPTEFSRIAKEQGIDNAYNLLDSIKYKAFITALLSSPEAVQRIMSDMFIVNPYSSVPDTLPVSFRLMGQRFIIDSYIFSNVVYDRIVYNNEKICRLMPDPLDAMFVLGNNNALPLLNNELNTYHYSSQLASLRYMVDAYDSIFWGTTLYNSWLQAIRRLNPPASLTAYPYFMQTAAWQQEKLNTQLASWTQLRHDNLLYAKQSYTGGMICSFPYSYVEPYPEFYRQISTYATKATSYFSSGWANQCKCVNEVAQYFSHLNYVCSMLGNISSKELSKQALDSSEIYFLRNILEVNPFHECGESPYNGWFPQLIFNFTDNDGGDDDYLIADVHTVPTDCDGALVGNILHAAVGKVNLGIFIAPSASNNNRMTAFIGPVMSYYNKVTSDFVRMTDQQWKDSVSQNILPSRPDWVNIYLANGEGNSLQKGTELPAELKNPVGIPAGKIQGNANELVVYPNPAIHNIIIEYNLKEPGQANISIYDLSGKNLGVLVSRNLAVGTYHAFLDTDTLAKGTYLLIFKTGHQTISSKIVVE